MTSSFQRFSKVNENSNSQFFIHGILIFSPNLLYLPDLTCLPNPKFINSNGFSDTELNFLMKPIIPTVIMFSDILDTFARRCTLDTLDTLACRLKVHVYLPIRTEVLLLPI